jgi:hypothetical protein
MSAQAMVLQEVTCRFVVVQALKEMLVSCLSTVALVRAQQMVAV